MQSASQRLMSWPEAEVLPLIHTGDSQKTLLKLALWRKVVGKRKPFFLVFGGDLETKENKGISIWLLTCWDLQMSEYEQAVSLSKTMAGIVGLHVPSCACFDLNRLDIWFQPPAEEVFASDCSIRTCSYHLISYHAPAQTMMTIQYNSWHIHENHAT